MPSSAVGDDVDARQGRDEIPRFAVGAGSPALCLHPVGVADEAAQAVEQSPFGVVVGIADRSADVAPVGRADVDLAPGASRSPAAAADARAWTSDGQEQRVPITSGPTRCSPSMPAMVERMRSARHRWRTWPTASCRRSGRRRAGRLPRRPSAAALFQHVLRLAAVVQAVERQDLREKYAVGGRAYQYTNVSPIKTSDVISSATVASYCDGESKCGVGPTPGRRVICTDRRLACPVSTPA